MNFSPMEKAVLGNFLKTTLLGSGTQESLGGSSEKLGRKKHPIRRAAAIRARRLMKLPLLRKFPTFQSIQFKKKREIRMGGERDRSIGQSAEENGRKRN